MSAPATSSGKESEQQAQNRVLAVLRKLKLTYNTKESIEISGENVAVISVSLSGGTRIASILKQARKSKTGNRYFATAIFDLYGDHLLRDFASAERLGDCLKLLMDESGGLTSREYLAVKNLKAAMATAANKDSSYYCGDEKCVDITCHCHAYMKMDRELLAEDYNNLVKIVHGASMEIVCGSDNTDNNELTREQADAIRVRDELVYHLLDSP